MTDLRLLKNKVVKNDKVYYDLVLFWTYEGKKYSCRIDSTFHEGYKCLLAMAENVTKEELNELVR